MTVYELYDLLENYECMGGDSASEIAIWHDGSYAKLIITDCIDKSNQTVIMGDE